MINLDQINFEKLDGLIPVCIQDNLSFQILMIGFMNREALEITIQTKRVTFWSRTKNRLWIKGETSGNYLEVINIYLDCDNDSVLIFAKANGPTCHTGLTSCFGEIEQKPLLVINELIKTIEDRFNNPKLDSYTTKLFAEGIKRIAQKVGEEGLEVALAAVCEDKKELSSEIADLIFHLLVLMKKLEVNFKDISKVLKYRMK